MIPALLISLLIDTTPAKRITVGTDTSKFKKYRVYNGTYRIDTVVWIGNNQFPNGPLVIVDQTLFFGRIDTLKNIASIYFHPPTNKPSILGTSASAYGVILITTKKE